MKIEIKYILEGHSEFDRELSDKQKALKNAFINQLRIETLYSDVFRGLIKHNENEEEVRIIEMVMKKVNEHFEED